MVDRLGEGILGEDGEIDRSRVAERVFADREALAWLEGLLHPKVSAEYLQWHEQLAELPNAPPVTVTEVPLLYEVGGEKRFDKVVVITAPEKLREARANVSLKGRSDRLLPDREKIKRADFSYVNTGSLEELDAWVAGVMEELRASSAPAPR
jgi:dephospho-CoA kinase